MNVEWPDRRADVLNGLRVLAAEPEEGWGWDGTLLTSAVHAVVDDTGWDLPHLDPSVHVGTILVSESEAALMRPLVAAICRVSERQGGTSSDASWFADEEWPLVRELAQRAAEAVGGNG